MNDANTDPSNLVFFLIKKKFGDEVNEVHRNDLQGYLMEFEDYFGREDLQGFFDDMESVAGTGGQMVSLTSVATAIRHASDGFPK